MPESELAKEMKEVIKKADKLVNDIRDDTWKLLKALRELRKGLEGRGDKDEEEPIDQF